MYDIHNQVAYQNFVKAKLCKKDQLCAPTLFKFLRVRSFPARFSRCLKSSHRALSFLECVNVKNLINARCLKRITERKENRLQRLRFFLKKIEHQFSQFNILGNKWSNRPEFYFKTSRTLYL